jgi:phage shock protein C
MNARRLYRSRQDRILGGVAGGVADYLGLDPALVRIAWAVLVLASAGSLFLLYIVMWIVVPEAPRSASFGTPAQGTADDTTPSAEGAPPPPEGTAAGEASAASGPTPSIGHEWAAHQRSRRGTDWSGEGGLILGSLLILAGAWFLARDYIPAFRNLDLWPTILIVVGLVLLLTALRPRAP